jgi:TP901 family phage tail tape measure protein
VADVNANIGVHIDTTQALAGLKNLQRQLATFHSSVAQGSAQTAAAQRSLQTNLLNSINATGMFTAKMGLVRTSTESFTHALENNKLSMGQYFRYAGASTKTFGRMFKSEFDTIGKVAQDRVKKMQTQYIKMGRDAAGATKAMSVTPLTLNMKDFGTQAAIAAQKQALFNQLVKQGSTNLLNFGKNTQWAGRQLMVGFSIPLAYFGAAAAKTFMALEAQAIRFKRVYGEMFTTSDQTDKALKDIEGLAKSFIQYGVKMEDTMKMAADAAAMGKMGAELTAQVAQATKLAVLGSVEQEKALETTISLTNAFGISADQLANKINFLNAVENQTVVNIEDLTTAIPKAGPVVKQLGGSVEDLAFFLTAMKEGGINASEGANALKSGLASLINPSKKAAGMLADMGININSIVEGNAGNLKATVIGFAQALDKLAPLDRARAIEQMFGKFQFARLSTLFQNITKDGTQANRVLGLTNASVEELAILSEREMAKVKDAVGTNFKASLESLKVSMVPIGKAFLEAVTPIVKFVGKVLEKFNGLDDGVKKFIVTAGALVGIIGPILLMTFGLVANGVANIIKLFLAMRMGFSKIGGSSKILAEQTTYLNAAQLESATVAASLNQAHSQLTQKFEFEAAAVRALRNAYVEATVAAGKFARTNPGAMLPPRAGGARPTKFATGTTSVPGPKGAGDIVPSLLSPGEAVIPAPVAQDPNFKPIIEGMVNGRIGMHEAGITYAGKPQTAGNGKSALVTRKQQAIQRYFDLKYGPKSSATPAMKAAYESNRNGFKDLSSRLVYDNKTKMYTYLGKDGKPLSVMTSKQLEQQIKYTFKETQSKMGGTSNRPTTPSTLDRYLGRLGKPGTGAPAAVRALRAKLNAQFPDKEGAKLHTELKKSGLNDQEIKKFMGTKDESHILKPKDSATKWQSGHTISDHTGLNNYLNRAGGSAVGKLVNNPKIGLPRSQGGLGLSQQEIKQLKNDYRFAQSQKHPTNPGELAKIARIAGLEVAANNAGIAKIDKVFQAKGVLALAKVRTPEFYKDIAKTIVKLGPTPKPLAEVVAVAKGEKVVAKGKRPVTLTGQNTEPKPAGMQTTSRNVADNRVANIPRGASIIPRGVRVRGAISGLDGTPPSTAVSNMDRQFRAEQNSLRRQIELQEKRRLSALRAEARLKQQEQTRAKQAEANRLRMAREDAKVSAKARAGLTKFSEKATAGMGALSSLTIAASFAGGSVGEMAQKMMPFIFGLQGVAMLLPALVKWQGMLGLTVAAFVGAQMWINSSASKARDKMLDLADATGSTSENMKKLSEFAGTVSAAELLNYKKSKAISPLTVAQGKSSFGEMFAQSEQGKATAAGLREIISKQGTKEGIETLKTQLSAAVASGVFSTAQARSIALSIGREVGNLQVGLQVNAELANLFGPDGKNILGTNGINLRVNLVEDQLAKAQNLAKMATGDAGLMGGKLPIGDNRVLGGGMDKGLFTGLSILGTASTGVQLGAAAGAGVGALFGGVGAAPGAAIGSVVGGIIGIGTGAVLAAKYMGQASARVAGFAAQTTTAYKSASDLSNQMQAALQLSYADAIKRAKLDGDIEKVKRLELELAEKSLRLQQQGARTRQSAVDFYANSVGLTRRETRKALEETTKRKYKDDATQSQYVSAATDVGKNMSGTLEGKIQMMMNYGSMTPSQIVAFDNMFADKGTKTKMFNIVAQIDTKWGGIVPGQATDIASGFTDLLNNPNEEATAKFYVDIRTAKTQGDVDKLLNLYGTLAAGSGFLDVGMLVSYYQKNPKAAAELEKQIEAVQANSGKLDIQVLQTFLPPKILGAFNQDYFNNLDQNARHVYTTTIAQILDVKDPKIITESDDFKTWMGETGKYGGAQYAGQKHSRQWWANTYAEGKAQKITTESPNLTPVMGPNGNGNGGAKDRDTTYDEILNDLKRTRDGTIDVTKGAKELLRILGGKKDITIFKGLDQQLAKLGANTAFIDWIGSLEKNVQNKLIRVAKNGAVALTTLGNAAKKAFDERALGRFSAESQNAITAAKAQRTAFLKLKIAGVETTEAIDLVAESDLAIAISSQKSSSEIKKMVDEWKTSKQQAELTLAMTDPKKYFADINDELKRQYDYQQKIMALQKSATESKIAGDYIGSAMIGQQKIQEVSDFNAESKNIDFNSKLATMKEALKVISNSKLKDPKQQALIQSTLSQGMLGIEQLRAFSPDLTKAAALQTGVPGVSNTFNNTPSSTTPTSGTVYNVTMTVNGANANAADIANQVIKKLGVKNTQNNKTNAVTP